MPEIDLDRERTEALMEVVMQGVKDHYLGNGGPRQALVLEALNALACSVACVIAGTAPNGLEECLKFFSDAFTAQLNKTLNDEAFRDMPTAPGRH